MNKRLTGLTLIELLVVLAILSLISGVALMGVRLPLAASRQALAIERVKSLDAMARSRTGLGTLRLRVDRRSGRVSLDDRATGRTVQVVDFQQPLWTAGMVSDEDGGSQVFYGRDGTCRSFAIGWRGRGRRAERTDWLLILGMTGQSYQTGAGVFGEEAVSREMVMLALRGDAGDVEWASW
ncbi:MAG: Tfp pilus assembly protein FimT/FimU [Novipirellula sp. JB048]